MGTKNWNTVNYGNKPKDAAVTRGRQMTIVPAQVLEDISELDTTNVFKLCIVSPDTVVRRIHAISGVVAHAAAADNDFGFYAENQDGTLVELDKDILLDGISFTTAIAARDLLGLNSSLNRDKTVRELLGKTFEFNREKIWLCMTMNTKETTADKTLDLDIMLEVI